MSIPTGSTQLCSRMLALSPSSRVMDRGSLRVALQLVESADDERPGEPVVLEIGADLA
jgi:hypothetical protein